VSSGRGPLAPDSGPRPVTPGPLKEQAMPKISVHGGATHLPPVPAVGEDQAAAPAPFVEEVVDGVPEPGEPPVKAPRKSSR
jgi:hypothetical protein